MQIRLERARRLAAPLLIVLAAATAVGCGREGAEQNTPANETTASGTGAFEQELTGRVRIDGSSTVGPLMTFAAERFRRQQPGVRVAVGISGTGGGFERFCRGETDISNASRPIKDEERRLCEQKGVEFVELHVANDGLSVVGNPQNDWADCLTVDQLKRVWQPGSRIRNWNQVDADFPSEKLTLYGAGTDSGTFDYFTEAIVGEEGRSRTDYNATENDDVTVRGVSGERGALGYLGLSYVEENEGRLKALEIDGGDGCVAPSAETVQNGSYRPLSRPLYVYVKTAALQRMEVAAFLEHVLDNERELARSALFVPLTDEQLSAARNRFEEAVAKVR